jgi:hypothetical protein
MGVQGIGSWIVILKMISKAAVVTNSGLICFSVNALSRFSMLGKLWIFLGFQWIMMAVQYILELAIPTIPEEVQIQKERIRYIEHKVIRKIEDDDYDSYEEKLKLFEDSKKSKLSFWGFLYALLTNGHSGMSHKLMIANTSNVTTSVSLPIQDYPNGSSTINLDDYSDYSRDLSMRRKLR